jgi:hypothetical protein
LIDLCYPSTGRSTPVPFWFKACSEFTASTDGRFLAYEFGPESCGRLLIVLDLQSGETVFESEAFGVHWFEYLENGKILVASGHCEGGGVSLYDPRTDTWQSLGSEGIKLWNPQHTALAVYAPIYMGFEGWVWGYNASRDFLFLPQPDEHRLENHMLWTPDGTHLFYQRREMVRDDTTWVDSFPTGREIIRVNASTGEVRTLASDPEYDYHLCEGVRSDCDHWHGDWIQVRRYDYSPQQFEFTGSDTPIIKCVLDGMQCEGEPVLFALNWRTGEMIPWDASILPTPMPTLTPTPGGDRG